MIYKAVWLVVIIFIAYQLGYGIAVKRTTAKYELQLKGAQLENVHNLIKTERELLNQQHEIVSGYLNEIERLKTEHEQDIIEINSLRDTVVVPNCLPDKNPGGAGVSKKTGNKPGLKCYTDAELLSKVKRSLDIAGQCDELAVKYNSLLELCRKQ